MRAFIPAAVIYFFWITILVASCKKDDDPVPPAPIPAPTTPCGTTSIVTDIDGNIYPVVNIGDQCWMAANLRTGQYRDGTPIEHQPSGFIWTLTSLGSWSNYANDGANDAVYGRLYNWYAASDPLICPQGWHVPTDAEWQQMEATLGMPGNELAAGGFRGEAENVGGKMKSTNMAFWSSPNVGATNESGFTALGGGARLQSDGSFFGLGTEGYWWSSEAVQDSTAWFRRLASGEAGIFRSAGAQRVGMCLRCVKD